MFACCGYKCAERKAADGTFVWLDSNWHVRDATTGSTALFSKVKTIAPQSVKKVASAKLRESQSAPETADMSRV